MSAIAVPCDLSFDELTRRFWNQGDRLADEAPRPMTDKARAFEAQLQTDLYFDPRWDELYGCHDGHVGSLIPSGLMVGTWQIQSFNSRGEQSCRWRSHRIITTAGKTAIAAYLSVASPTSTPFMRFLSSGTGTATAAIGDTALGGGAGNPITEIATAASSQRITGTGSNSTNVLQQQATTASGRYSGQTIAEAGMHDAVGIQTVAGTPVGVMYDRALLSPSATLGALDTLQLTFQITFT